MSIKLTKLWPVIFLLYSFSSGLANAKNSEKNTAKKTPTSLEEEDFDNANFSNNYSDEIYDPLEKVNRKIFAFNEFVDHYFFEHIARGYRFIFPQPVRNSIGNFLYNLSLPLVTVNSLLQGDADNSMASFSTFLINTTLGVGGLFDVADRKRIKHNKEDFGQTFAKYKIKQGAYLVLPFFGPSNLRDASGLLVEKLVDPLSFNVLEVGGNREFINREASISLAVIYEISNRESLLDVIDDAKKNSFDFYATARSAYLQKRNSLISNN